MGWKRDDLRMRLYWRCAELLSRSARAASRWAICSPSMWPSAAAMTSSNAALSSRSTVWPLRSRKPTVAEPSSRCRRAQPQLATSPQHKHTGAAARPKRLGSRSRRARLRHRSDEGRTDSRRVRADVIFEFRGSGVPPLLSWLSIGRPPLARVTLVLERPRT